MAAICAVGVAATAAFAVTAESAPPSHVSAAPNAAPAPGSPVVFAAVEQVRRRQGTCASGWLPGSDGCFRLAPNSLRVDSPRNVELVIDPTTNEKVVRLTMSDSDTVRFDEITAALEPHQGMLAIIVDDQVVSAPIIMGHITGPTVEILPTEVKGGEELFHRIK
ncbi:SecDF P1 head subdomain-containing protein [Couchioplanes caeruleus]|uniref:SecDF P1 head subdomain-containing protein n=1 Tax=Couchioplanes caeruleus TaxID=56438 RepID=UPI00116056B5|nr:hypothetical protein [Couchioplanes caeruleus]